MTEAERTSRLPEKDDVADASRADPGSSLRRAVIWLAVVAFLYAAGAAAGVFFGIVYYRVVSADRPSGMQSNAVRLAQMFIVERVMLLGACLVLGRALWRYAGALRPANADGAHVEPAMLTTRQLSCWQALTWAALLYAGWEMTIAFAAR